MKILKCIPNLLTLLNLLSGCLAVIYAINNQIQFAVLFVFLGIFFDFFDGFAARIFKVQSELGKQLDSLADMITSGVVPGVVMVQMLLKANHKDSLMSLQGVENFPVEILFGLAITMASCYRLANFNIDENQKESFVGLPTPANTLFVVSLPLLQVYDSYSFIDMVLENYYLLLVVTALSCYMLNAKIELFALKFKTFGFLANKLIYLFLLLSLVLMVFFKLAALPLIIVLYVLLSLVKGKFFKL